MYYNYRHLITSFQQWWLQPAELIRYCNVIQSKGSILPRCFGFIDGEEYPRRRDQWSSIKFILLGTIHFTCRPTRFQQQVYSGHKRGHGLKYQSIVLPNGLIANLYGPVVGIRHDSFMMYDSGLPQQMQTLLGAQNFYLYGDPGYPIRRFLITPFLGNNLTQAQREFNSTMSKMRICVEWEFGDLFEQFAFLDFRKNQKIYLQPVSKYMFVSAILKNCKTCLRGCQTSMYFNLSPPTLESYVKNDPNL